MCLFVSTHPNLMVDTTKSNGAHPLSNVSTVPPYYILFGGKVPPHYVLFGGTVPPCYVLFGGTVPPNSFSLLLKQESMLEMTLQEKEKEILSNLS